MTSEQAFDMLDDNGDGVLTIKEIEDGMKLLMKNDNKLDLTPEQLKEFLKVLDANGDGVLDPDEWKDALEGKIIEAKEFAQLMGGIDVEDPIALQERILDFQFRNRKMESELKVLRKGRLVQQKQELKNLSKDIVKAEAEDANKQSSKEAERDREMDEKRRADL